MTERKGTWDATTDELQRMIGDMDAGTSEGTESERAFLVGAIRGLQGQSDDVRPLPGLSEDALTANRHAIEDLRDRVNAGEFLATVDERECLNRYACFLDEPGVSGGYPVDYAGGDVDGGPAAPSDNGNQPCEPQNDGLSGGKV